MKRHFRRERMEPTQGTAPTGGTPPSDGIDAWILGRSGRRTVRAFLRTTREAVALVWRASRSRLLTAAGLQLLGALLAVGQIVVIKWAMESLIRGETGNSPSQDALAALLAVAVAYAGTNAAMTVAEQLQRLLAEDVQRRTWDNVLDVALDVDLEVFEQPTFFDHLSRVQVSAIQRPLDVTRGLVAVVGGVAGAGALFLVLLPIHPALLPVLALGGVPLWFVMRRLSRFELAFVRANARTYRERNYLRSAMLDREKAPEIRAFGLEHTLRTKYDVQYDRYLASFTDLVHRRIRYTLVGSLLSSVALAGALGLLLWLVQSDRVDLSSAAAAALAMRLLSSRIDTLVRGIGSLNESALFLDDLAALSAWQRPPRGPARRCPPFRRLTVEHVTFTYPGATRPALDDVTLDLQLGAVVALVGENGSGKTTLAKLAAGLYQPTDGAVRWDGVDTRDLDPREVRRQTAVIFQDFARWELSAHDNIGLGRPEHLDDVAGVRRAAEAAGAGRFLTELPDGWQTVLSHHFAAGADLSVGQWQRVALARALYSRAPLVILDEPTSALDARGEARLFAQIRELFAGHAVLLISHRLSSVVQADAVHVLDRGRIVESGSHRDLMARRGLYHELFSTQAAAYVKGSDDVTASDLGEDPLEELAAE